MKTSMFRWNAVFVSLVLLSAVGLAQTRPTAPPSGPTTPTRPTAPTSIPTQPQQRQPQMTRPIFIMGDVVTGDGTPVPRNIEIHRVCNGRDRREGYTDSAGHFSFQLGGEQVMQDASSDDSGFGSMPGQPSSMGMGMGS